MRPLLVILMASFALAACADGGPAGGVANYDTLRQATDACAAKGGHLTLQKNGDPEYIGDYACERK